MGSRHAKQVTREGGVAWAGKQRAQVDVDRRPCDEQHKAQGGSPQAYADK